MAIAPLAAPPFLRTLLPSLADMSTHPPPQPGAEREAAAQRLELILDAMPSSETEDEAILAGAWGLRVRSWGAGMRAKRAHMVGVVRRKKTQRKPARGPFFTGLHPHPSPSLLFFTCAHAGLPPRDWRRATLVQFRILRKRALRRGIAKLRGQDPETAALRDLGKKGGAGHSEL